MDLGYKTLNNLTSKDFNLQKQAAKEIVDSKDIKAFEILDSKAEFIFDFIKEKILKNLTDAINSENISNLFEFMKIYSEDFKDFITESLIEYNSKEIEVKMLNLLEFGTNEEKTYAILFFTKIKNENTLIFAKKYIKSDFAPLKNSSIKLLSSYKEKEEFKKALSLLSSNADDYEKMESVEFLALYGDKEAFGAVFEYLKENPTSDIIASNLLLIKSFQDLIKEDNKDAIYGIFSSIVWNFPDSITFDEISYYLKDGVFDYLLEADDDFAFLLLLYIKDKLSFALNDEAYSIDFTKNTTQEAKNILSQLNSMTEYINKKEIVSKAFMDNNKIKILIALYLSEKNQKEEIQNLAIQNKDSEIKIACANLLKEKEILEKSFINELEKTVDNPAIKVLIQNLLV